MVVVELGGSRRRRRRVQQEVNKKETQILESSPRVRTVLKRSKRKVFRNGSFAKRPRAAHMFNRGWWRLAVGGWW